MNPDTTRRLRDAGSACLEIEFFSEGKTIDMLRGDRGLQLILHKLVEIVGEALNRAAKSEPAVIAEVPNLRRFVNTRNQITHGYDTVDYDIVWQVATEEVPRLKAVLDSLVSDEQMHDDPTWCNRSRWYSGRTNIMIALVTDNRDAIAALCRKYRSRKLELFGSATTDAFDPVTSDLDFIVDLGGYEPGVARRYFGFIYAMEDLLGYPVEMITEAQIRNPYFREAVEEQRMPVYEAGNSEAVA